MERIVDYNSFNENLRSGDIVVFNNGERKTIKKIDDGHRVIFTDGDKRDLWIIKDSICGIIYLNLEKQESPAVPIDYDAASNYSEPSKKFKSLATSYKELSRLLYHGEPIEFYHITAFSNALEILNGEYFCSRDAGLEHIKYDNVEMNDTSSSVMATNFSSRIEQYARFYLNIKNPATYSMQKNYKNNGTFGVIFAVDFPTIWRSKTNVILSPISAHYLIDSDFDWKKYNIGLEKNIKNLNASKFNLKRTFAKCDFEEDNPYLMAEIMFYNKISLNNVSHIYFKDYFVMNSFLSKLTYNKRALFESKCTVRKDLFW